MKRFSKFIILIIALALIGCIAACDDIGFEEDVIVTTLNAPTNVRVESGYVCWNPVENATKYVVSIDDKETYSEDYRMVLPTLSDGEHIFKVKAEGNGILFLTSAYSDEYKVNFENNEVAPVTEGYYSQFDELTRKESFLGYGFDVINSSVFCDKYVNTSYPIFNTDELMNQRLLKVDSKRVYINETQSTSIEEFMASWNANANVGVSWDKMLIGGSVDVEAKYSGGSETAKSKYYHAISIYNQKFYIVMQANMDTYRNILSDGFSKDLYSQMSPSALFDKYGTHFITSAVMGGRINSYYLYTSEKETSFNDISAKVSVEVRSVFGTETNVDVSGGYKNEAKEQGIDIVNTLEVIGGGDFAMLSDSDISPNYAGWEQSLDNYSALMGIKDSGSLTAIWELIDASKDTNEYTWDYEDGNGPVKVTRAQQLEAYFYKYGLESYNELCENAGIREIITPTAITDVRVNNEESASDTFEVYSGTTCSISFNYLPENAIGNKSITLITDSPYINIKENLQVEILHGIPEDSSVTLQLVAGTVTKIIKLHVTGLYDVQLRLNGGNISEEVINGLKGLLGGTWIETPEEPTRAGYTFIGWYTDYYLKVPYEETSITSDFSLYAKWVAYKPLVTFETLCEATIEPINVKYNNSITKPNNPLRTGYVFVNWYLDEEYTDEFDFTTKITEDITLFAKWDKIEYTVSFVTNDGTPLADVVTSIEEEYLIKEPITTKTFYTLEGWYTDANFVNRFYFSTVVTKNITLFAKWVPTQVEVRFYDSETNTTAKDVLGFDIEPQYTDVTKNFKISSVATPVNGNCVFNGWYYGGTIISDMTAYNFEVKDGGYTCYATWKTINYAVSLNANGGNANSGFMATIDQKLPEFTAVTRASYKLLGYYTAKEGGTKVITAEGSLVANIDGYSDANGNWIKNSTTELYAQWQSLTYNITYNLNGGAFGANHPTELVCDTTYTINNPTKAGYTFNGWNISGMDSTTHMFGNTTSNNTSASGIKETSFRNLRSTSGYVLFEATWDVVSYNIGYNLNSGSYGSLHPTVVACGADFTVSNPTRTGYDFIGWNITGMDSCTHTYGGNNSTATTLNGIKSTTFKNLRLSAGTVKFTATWQIKSYTLTITYTNIINGNSVSSNYSKLQQYNSAYEVKSPSLSGYTAQTKVISGTMPANNCTFEVKYLPVAGYATSTFSASVKCESTIMGQAEFTVYGQKVKYNGAEYIYGSAYYSGKITGGKYFGDVETFYLKDCSKYVLIGGNVIWSGDKGNGNHSGVASWSGSSGTNMCYYPENLENDFAGDRNVSISISGICVATGSALNSQYDYPEIGSTTFDATLVLGDVLRGKITFSVIGIKVSYDGKEYIQGSATYSGTPGGGDNVANISKITLRESTKAIKLGGSFYWRSLKGNNSDWNGYAVHTSGGWDQNFVNYTCDNSSDDLRCQENTFICITDICVATGADPASDVYHPNITESQFTATLYCETTKECQLTFNMTGFEIYYYNDDGSRTIYQMGLAWYHGDADANRFNDVDSLYLSACNKDIRIGGKMFWHNHDTDANVKGTAAWDGNSGTYVGYISENPYDDINLANSWTNIQLFGICVKK